MPGGGEGGGGAKQFRLQSGAAQGHQCSRNAAAQSHLSQNSQLLLTKIIRGRHADALMTLIGQVTTVHAVDLFTVSLTALRPSCDRNRLTDCSLSVEIANPPPPPAAACDVPESIEFPDAESHPGRPLPAAAPH